MVPLGAGEDGHIGSIGVEVAGVLVGLDDEDRSRPATGRGRGFAGVIRGDLTWGAPTDIGGTHDTHGAPCIVNVGSVGQPRDGDRRASYALFDGQVVTFRRVEYDVEAAARDILATKALPPVLAQRLVEGW